MGKAYPSVWWARKQQRRESQLTQEGLNSYTGLVSRVDEQKRASLPVSDLLACVTKQLPGPGQGISSNWISSPSCPFTTVYKALWKEKPWQSYLSLLSVFCSPLPCTLSMHSSTSWPVAFPSSHLSFVQIFTFFQGQFVIGLFIKMNYCLWIPLNCHNFYNFFCQLWHLTVF